MEEEKDKNGQKGEAGGKGAGEERYPYPMASGKKRSGWAVSPEEIPALLALTLKLNQTHGMGNRGGNSAVGEASTSGNGSGPSAKKPKKEVLEEDVYMAQLEKIIERDYFPDLEKLQAQNAFIDAQSNNDVQMLRELHDKYSRRGSKTPKTRKTGLGALDTPTTFDTPAGLKSTLTSNEAQASSSTPTHLPMEDPKENAKGRSGGSKKGKKLDPSSLKLDTYLNKYTSEDNQSFEDFMDETTKKQRMKFPWAVDMSEDYKNQMEKSKLVPSIEEQAKGGEKPLSVDTWSYTNKNALIFVPEPAPFTEKEIVKRAREKTEVLLENTRFKKSPFKTPLDESALTPKPRLIAQNLHNFTRPVEQIGIDGKEILTETPQVQGFKLVRTPSPTPGVAESPLMTWGEIEGTPFRLDAGDTPIPVGATAPPYRMLEQSKRDRLGLELAEKASAGYRDKKLKAIEAAKMNLITPSPLKVPLSQLSSMSPAIQKFMNSHYHGTSSSSVRSLRDSYNTPSRGTATPSTIRSSSSQATPTPASKTTTVTSKKVETRNVEITDNLLSLPKVDPPSNSKPNASDFFE